MKTCRNTNVLLLILFCTLFFQQCKTEQVQEPVSPNPAIEFNQLTGSNSKTWKISTVTINGVSQPLDNCQKSTEITFAKEKTGILDFYNTDCSKKPDAFAWEYVLDTLYILLATEEKQKLIIQELNEATFKYTTEAAEDLKYEFVLTRK